MTSVQVKSAHFSAMMSELITIEANFMRGFSGLSLIGSSSEICKGGLLRAQSALESLNYKLPERKTLVSLFPADQKKEGNQFDLAFSVCLFALTQKDIKIRTDLSEWLFAAELGLDGKLNSIKGSISFTLKALASGLKGIVVSQDNFAELKELLATKDLENEDFSILAFTHLKEVLSWTQGKELYQKHHLQSSSEPSKGKPQLPNFDDMLLSEELSSVALAVATGGHNLFISGSPGTGKSMFSQRIPSIIPKLAGSKKIELLQIHSAFTSQIEAKILEGNPPFRSPHHSASTGAVLGSAYSPGEVSLAHNGILFLDEFPEFRKDIIEALREPLETGHITVSRAKTKISWDCHFVLLVAANNCPCGWLGSNRRRCICPTNKILNYKRKLSGPILDRIDIHVNLSENLKKPLSLLTSLGSQQREKSKITRNLREKVKKAREFSEKRNAKWKLSVNAELKAENIIEAFGSSEKEFNLLLSQLNLDKLTNRSMLKVLKVARTLSDLELSPKVQVEHIKKALSWSSHSCAKGRGDLAYGFV